MSQRRGAYAPEFRQQMVELVAAGRKVSELAKEFGCHETSISAWVRQAQANVLGVGRSDASLTTAVCQELSQLRRQVRQITMERDILAEAIDLRLRTRTAVSTRHLRADPSKPGRSTHPSHVPPPRCINKRLLRLVPPYAKPAQFERSSHDRAYSADSHHKRLHLWACQGAS